jgi:hypothetical protein
MNPRLQDDSLPFARCSRQLFIFWLAVIMATVVASLPTLTVSSRLQYDEAFMVDSGRIEWPRGDCQHAFTWIRDNRPLRVLSFLGPVAIEGAFQAASANLLGVRLFTLVGAVVAATAAFSWIRARGSSLWVAACCSLLLFWDPLLTNSYRGGRPDAWAIALMLAALAAIRGDADRAPSRWHLASWHLKAGMLAGLGVMTWISGVLLAPLFLSEIWARDADRRPRVRQRFFLNAAVVGCVALAVIAALIGGYSGHVMERFSDYALHAGMIPPGSQWNKAAFVRCLARSLWPLVLCVPLLLLYGRRLLPSLSALLLASVAVLGTGAYDHRMTYLLPYFLAIISDGDTTIQKGRTRPWVMRGIAGLITFSLLYCVAYSVVARTAVALSLPRGRNPESLTDAMAAAIGRGNYRVLITTPEPYYASRALGWNLFCRIGPFDDRQLADLIQNVDFVVMRPLDLDRATGDELRLSAEMEKAGFVKFRTVSTNPADASAATVAEVPAGYGPFDVFHPRSQAGR